MEEIIESLERLGQTYFAYHGQHFMPATRWFVSLTIPTDKPCECTLTGMGGNATGSVQPSPREV